MIVALISQMSMRPIPHVIVQSVVIIISLAIIMVRLVFAIALHCFACSWLICYVMISYVGINISPLEVIFYKANRDVDTAILNKYTDWVLREVRSRPKAADGRLLGGGVGR
jgi:hypothetical protein